MRDGERVELRDGDTLVAEGGPTELLLDVPDAGAARRGGRRGGGRPRDLDSEASLPQLRGLRPRARARATGCGIFPAALRAATGCSAPAGRPASWRATATAGCGRAGVGGAGLPDERAGGELRRGAADGAGSLAARLGCPVRVGEPHTILSWGLEVDGRKRRAAAALYDSDGVLTCASRALWIELRQQRSRSARAWPRTSEPARSAKPPAVSRSRPRDGEVVSVRGDARGRLQPRLHLPEGVRDQAAARGPGPPHHAAGAPRRRARRGELGRGVRGDRPAPRRRCSRSTARTRWPSTSATRTRTTCRR